MNGFWRLCWLSLGLFLTGAGAAHAQRMGLNLVATTTIEHAGLLAKLLPLFERESGLLVKTIVTGSGQALEIGKRGDADVLWVHDPLAEARFVAQGWGVLHQPVMSNQFMLAGSRDDPAQVKGLDWAQALTRIEKQKSLFVSRGDASGTHHAELRAWKLAGITPQPSAVYRACGCGAGHALNMAQAMGAYVFLDEATWLSSKNRAQLTILIAGDERFTNTYSVMMVNPTLHPHVQAGAARHFIRWLTSGKVQHMIGQHQVEGTPLFHPAAKP
jgi:tungstate transport system substrate-binding protein